MDRYLSWLKITLPEITFHIFLVGNHSVINSRLTTGDFSGPAESNHFVLGSFIPIMASVVHNGHQPLLLLLEECVASTSSELQSETGTYPIITNKGYFS